MKENINVNEIELNGIQYVKKDSISTSVKAINTQGLRYCVIRTVYAGVHTGFLKERNGDECTLLQARRIWKWDGAATLSQLSVDGVKKPDTCKMPCEVDEIDLIGVIEVIPTTKKAMESIRSVKVWQE
jgi:hypothetical protein